MDYIEEIQTKKIDFKKYKNLTPNIYKQSICLSRKIPNKKIIHINSTSVSGGGGVSELLRSQIPLEKSLGFDSRWFVIKGNPRFFEITKKAHNLLQGKSGDLSQEEKKFYFQWLNKKIAPCFKKLISREKPGIIIINDPQPLPLIDFIPSDILSILRMHIDTSTPDKSTLNFFKPLIKKYKIVIFSHPKHRPLWLPVEKTRIIMPAIDPFTKKNQALKKQDALKILSMYGIDAKKPIISQVSRFDPWKNQLETLKIYRLAKKKVPGLQLILIGLSWAKDDPEAIDMFKKIKKNSRNDADVWLFFNPKKLNGLSNNLLINAVYTGSNVIIQKSIREGFGMTITEAMWKKKSVIGSNANGIKLQIKHRKNGFLASTSDEAAKYLVQLLKDSSLRANIGRNAHQTIKNDFLLSRLILDYLKIFYSY
ncbi:MAG: glycosyltransferase [Patescibacteria group bacterium]|nr:glycosyltransferase [Patescibacteria group bacterium]